ncbi:MAG: hypothetical protein HJJLKODD_02611 [Phycisphaerae bacterium]|nr:hypothetical protein [Phycisphaerae bacterium]
MISNSNPNKPRSTGTPSPVEPRQPHRRTGHGLLRTIRLIIISLATVGIAFIGYQMMIEPVEVPSRTVQFPEEHRPFLENQPLADNEQESGILINKIPVYSQGRSEINILDDNLRRKIYIRHEGWSQADDTGKTFKMDRPRMVFFMERGETLEIRADSGILTSRFADRLDPQKGSFTGNVRIVLDRTTDADRSAHPEWATRPTPQDRLVRLWLENMEYDLDWGWMKSAGGVRLELKEMRLVGKDLSAEWNSVTQQLEKVTLASGEEMVIRAGMELDLNVDQPAKSQLADSASTQPAATLQPVVSPSDLKNPPPSATTIASFPEDVLIIDLPTISASESGRIESFAIDFSSAVRALQRKGEINEGELLADKMHLVLDLGLTGADAGESPGTTSAPADPWATMDNETDAGWLASPETSRLVIRWQGPLHIERTPPPEATTEPALLRRELRAYGQPVQLSNSSGLITAAQLIYQIGGRQLQLFGSDQQMIEISGVEAGTQRRLQAREQIFLDLESRLAQLQGQVLITQEDFLLQGEWVEARFTALRDPSGSKNMLDRLEQLECHRGVMLQQQADQVRCEFLRLEMQPDARGRSLARHAHAQGAVVVVQGTRRITAEEFIDVTFGNLLSPAAGQPQQQTPPMKQLLALGSITIVDLQRGWDIAGQSLICDFDEQQNITRGFIEGRDQEWANVRLGNYLIRGADVIFDDLQQYAHVPGAGETEFMLAEDLDGRTLDQPTPVRVTWQKEMTLRGLQNQLDFAGQVQARSIQNTLQGDQMQVQLEEVTDAEQSPTPADSAPMNLWFLRPFSAELQNWRRDRDEGSTQWVQRYRKRPRQILVNGQARLESRNMNESGEVLRSRLSLMGPQLQFDIPAQVMLMNGAGRLLIEDYSSLEDVARRKQQGSTGLFAGLDAEGPSQTGITWDESMRYYYAQRVAEFNSQTDPVQLRHFAGSKLLQIPEEAALTAEDLAQMEKAGMGRRAYLICRQLLVEFAATAQNATGGGSMSIGQLQKFQAQGDVLLDEDRWYVKGERLDYYGDTQMISVFGQSGGDAYISGVNPDSGLGVEWYCPQMDIELRLGRVQAPGCKGQSIGAKPRR